MRWNLSAKTKASRIPGKLVETLAAARSITVEEIKKYNAFSFDPGGAARTITLPAEAACAGVFLFISNEADAAEIITLNDDAAAAICTPTQAEAAFLYCDGISWFGLVGASS